MQLNNPNNLKGNGKFNAASIWLHDLLVTISRNYVSYCPRSNSKLTQYPSGVCKPQQNQYEICGLVGSVYSRM
ncbi:MAG: hypothetical protein K9M81_00950 [Chthoniobacterales bacterium]|nr:hypothetical protein [Chthoniobacterales bacterium]